MGIKAKRATGVIGRWEMSRGVRTIIGGEITAGLCFTKRGKAELVRSTTAKGSQGVFRKKSIGDSFHEVGIDVST